MDATSARGDPKPTPPARPEPGDCCQGGCERCVFDLHEDAMERFREALRDWETRNATSRE